MAFRRSVCVFVFGVSVAGCATHPLPEHATGRGTVQIVGHIRCEARDAIETAIGRYLSGSTDEATQHAGALLLSGHPHFADIKLASLPPEYQNNIRKYLPAAIAYDFTFDITQGSTLSAQADFLDTFTKGVFSLGLKAENDRQRQTIRNFRVSDTFSDLLNKGLVCPKSIIENNRIYPIAGNIGLNEVITTFVDLNEFQHLIGTKDKETVPVLADQFNFQTTVSGSATPQITLSHVNGLSDASLAAAGSRKDIHKVIVALSLPPTETLAIVSDGKTPAEIRAIDEIERQVERNILSNVVVRPNL